ncbi:MAG: hypothetical protein S4CHLAM37_04840 [Chlamydiia bacterium]|nr:hypothetical protein [Chlamydiia bacterium]
MFKLYSSLFGLALLAITHLSASDTEISLKRKRGTFVKGYYSYVESEKKAPLVVFIDGSKHSSVYENHHKLAKKFMDKGFSFVSLEKEGITKDSYDESIFMKYDCLENRLVDHNLLFKEIQKADIIKEPSHVILVGGSEGGKLAPILATTYKDKVNGLILIGSGGGLPFAEELTYQLNEALLSQNVVKKVGYKIRKSLKPDEIEKQMKKMQKKPDSLKLYAHKTYKWWNSYLSYNPMEDLLSLDVPIFMVHGAKDKMVPVKSADLVVDAFKKADKKNLKYGRYLDLSHALTGREDVYEDILSFAESVVAYKKS